jgi:hypothetical protein
MRIEVAAHEKASLALRQSHAAKGQAVVDVMLVHLSQPPISRWRCTNALPTLSYRGWVFHASVGIDGTADLMTFKEERVPRIE